MDENFGEDSNEIGANSSSITAEQKTLLEEVNKFLSKKFACRRREWNDRLGYALVGNTITTGIRDSNIFSLNDSPVQDEFEFIKQYMYRFLEIKDKMTSKKVSFLQTTHPYPTQHSIYAYHPVISLSESAAKRAALSFSYNDMLNRYNQIRQLKYNQLGDLVSLPEFFADLHFFSVLRESFSFNFGEIKRLSIMNTTNENVYYEGVASCLAGNVLSIQQVGYIVLGEVNRSNISNNHKKDPLTVMIKVDRGKVTESQCLCNKHKIPTMCSHVVALIVYRHVMKDYLQYNPAISESIDEMTFGACQNLIHQMIGFFNIRYSTNAIYEMVTKEGDPDYIDLGDLTINQSQTPKWQYSSVMKGFRQEIIPKFLVDQKNRACELDHFNLPKNIKKIYYLYACNIVARSSQTHPAYNILNIAEDMLERDDKHLIRFVLECSMAMLTKRDIVHQLYKYQKKERKSGCTYDFHDIEPRQLIAFNLRQDNGWRTLATERIQCFPAADTINKLFDCLTQAFHDPFLTRGFLIRLAHFLFKLHLKGWVLLGAVGGQAAADRFEDGHYSFFDGFKEPIAVIIYRLKGTFDYELTLEEHEECVVSKVEKDEFERYERFLLFKQPDYAGQVLPQHKERIRKEILTSKVWLVPKKTDFFMLYCNNFYFTPFRPQNAVDSIISALKGVNYLEELKKFLLKTSSVSTIKIRTNGINEIKTKITYMYKALLLSCQKLRDLNQTNLLYILLFEALSVVRVFAYCNEVELEHCCLYNKLVLFLMKLDIEELRRQVMKGSNDLGEKINLVVEKHRLALGGLYVKSPFLAKTLIELVELVYAEPDFEDIPEQITINLKCLVQKTLDSQLTMNEFRNPFIYESNRHERFDLFIFCIKKYTTDKSFIARMANKIFDLNYHRLYDEPYGNGKMFLTYYKLDESNQSFNQKPCMFPSEDYMITMHMFAKTLFILGGGQLNFRAFYPLNLHNQNTNVKTDFLIAAFIGSLYANGIDRHIQSYYKTTYFNVRPYFKFSLSILTQLHLAEDVGYYILSKSWKNCLGVRDVFRCIETYLTPRMVITNYSISYLICELLKHTYLFKNEEVQRMIKFVKNTDNLSMYRKCLMTSLQSVSESTDRILNHTISDVEYALYTPEGHFKPVILEELCWWLVELFQITDNKVYGEKMKFWSSKGKADVEGKALQIENKFIGGNDYFLGNKGPFVLSVYTHRMVETFYHTNYDGVVNPEVFYQLRGQFENGKTSLIQNKKLNNDYLGGCLRFNTLTPLSIDDGNNGLSPDKFSLLDAALDAGLKSLIEFLLNVKVQSQMEFRICEKLPNNEAVIKVMELAIRMGPVAINRFLFVIMFSTKAIGTLLEIHRILMGLLRYREVVGFKNRFVNVYLEGVVKIDKQRNLFAVDKNGQLVINEVWENNFCVPYSTFPFVGIRNCDFKLYSPVNHVEEITNLNEEIKSLYVNVVTDINITKFTQHMLNAVIDALAIRIQSPKNRIVDIRIQFKFLWHYCGLIIREITRETDPITSARTKNLLLDIYRYLKGLDKETYDHIKYLKEVMSESKVFGISFESNVFKQCIDGLKNISLE
uniref:SWIM-type domain-containing protein n=1 Tax=Rhabditophanes sp. KR3021 TaxID=114890 RepID=A0AC35TXB5_9BILA